MMSKGVARGGFSLLEIIAVIGVCAALFLVVSVLLVGVLQASASNTMAVAWQQTFQRLSQDWRTDVRSVSEVEVDDKFVRLGDIEYCIDAEEIRRVEHFQKDARHFQEDVRQREAYRLPVESDVAWHIDEQAGFATIRITSNKRTMIIVAAIGLNLRYLQEALP